MCSTFVAWCAGVPLSQPSTNIFTALSYHNQCATAIHSTLRTPAFCSVLFADESVAPVVKTSSNRSISLPRMHSRSFTEKAFCRFFARSSRLC